MTITTLKITSIIWGITGAIMIITGQGQGDALTAFAISALLYVGAAICERLD